MATKGASPPLPQELADAPLLQQQACYLPCSEDGLPLIGRVPGLDNAFLATGKCGLCLPHPAVLRRWHRGWRHVDAPPRPAQATAAGAS